MLPTINGKSIIDCSKEDFEVIVDNSDYRENEYIDYKQSFSFLECPKNSPQRAEHIAEFRSDVCAFANADGGYLIYGVSDVKGLASELVGIVIPGDNTDKFELELKNKLQSIQPKMPSIKFKFVLLDNNKYLVVILIQRDAFAPYIHLHNEKDYKIYKRVGNGKTAMSYSEMKMQFNQSLSLAQEVEKFRNERISFFQSIEDDTLHSFSRFIMIHIIPDTFVDPVHNKNVYVLNKYCSGKISGIFAPFSCSSYVKPNVDGIKTVGYECRQEGQVYNNGIAECFIPAEGNYISKKKLNDIERDFFAHAHFYDDLEVSLQNYFSAMDNILDTHRVLVCITILGARNAITYPNYTFVESSKIDRARMIINPVLFENIHDEASILTSMKRLKIDYHLAIGLNLSIEEIQEIKNGQV